MNKTLMLGAHMSIAGGFERAITEGELLGCTAIQLFVKSNRQWSASPITQPQINLFLEAKKKSTIRSFIAHAGYLINLASPDETTRRRSQEALRIELERCQALDIPTLVLHPGSSLISSLDVALPLLAKSLDTVLNEAESTTSIALETMAGQGSSLGSSFQELATVYNALSTKDRVGVCIDTCHLFAAGYNITETEAYEAVWQDFERTLGLDLIKAIHLNDSKKELGSRVDRHEDIGKGKMGLQAFRLLMNDPRFFAIPKVLETPRASLADYENNLKQLVPLLLEKNIALLKNNPLQRYW